MQPPEPPGDLEDLVGLLRTLELPAAPSRGGPYRGIVHNDVTRAIVGAGDAVVPLLVDRLPESGFDEASYIVFLLRELGAAEAVSAVQQLQLDVDRRSAGHDMTLKVQVNRFLDDIAP